MFQILDMVYCEGLGAGIDEALPNLVSTLVTIIKIGIPVILIIFGMMDLGKAVMSNDEKEMKAAQGKFIKRCLYAVLVFFIVAIVQFVVNILDGTDGENDNITANSCINCFINGKCDSTSSDATSDAE